MRRLTDLLDRAAECKFVGFGRPRKTAQFSNKLERRGMDFLMRSSGLEIMQSLNVPAHKHPLSGH